MVSGGSNKGERDEFQRKFIPFFLLIFSIPASPAHKIKNLEKTVANRSIAEKSSSGSNGKKTIMNNFSSISNQNINFQPLILIIENDDDTRMMMKYLLQMWKFSVIATERVEQALSLAANLPQLILMGDQANLKDSYDAIRRLRQLPNFGETAIIFISAFADSSARSGARAAGADNFLVKPINFGVLEATLGSHLTAKPRKSELFL